MGICISNNLQPVKQHEWTRSFYCWSNYRRTIKLLKIKIASVLVEQDATKKFVTHKVLRLHVINVLLIEPRISENDLNSGTFKVFQVKKKLIHCALWQTRNSISVRLCATWNETLSLSLSLFILSNEIGIPVLPRVSKYEFSSSR